MVNDRGISDVWNCVFDLKFSKIECSKDERRGMPEDMKLE